MNSESRVSCQRNMVDYAGLPINDKSAAARSLNTAFGITDIGVSGRKIQVMKSKDRALTDAEVLDAFTLLGLSTSEERIAIRSATCHRPETGVTKKTAYKVIDGKNASMGKDGAVNSGLERNSS